MSLAELEQLQNEEEGLTNEEIAAGLAFLVLITQGAFSSSNVVKRVQVDQLAFLTSTRARTLGLQLTEGAITNRMFITEMIGLIEQGQTASAMLWAEGTELTLAQQRLVTTVIDEQLTFLSQFEQRLINGTMKTTPAANAQMYGQAVRPTYFRFASEQLREEGFNAEQNILNPADHCNTGQSCVGETARGIVPLGALVPIGNRTCLSNCQCSIRYINTSTNQMVIV